MALKAQLQKLSKGGDSTKTYLMHLKKLTNQLAAVGEPISHKDQLAYMLEGLPAEYDALVSAIYN